MARANSSAQSFATLRDTLLPKLLSGEMNVYRTEV